MRQAENLGAAGDMKTGKASNSPAAGDEDATSAVRKSTAAGDATGVTADVALDPDASTAAGDVKAATMRAG